MKNNVINKEILELLDSTERKIAILYYGIKAEKLDYKKIAQKLDMSEEYVDFIIENIKDKVNNYYKEKKTNIEHTPKKKAKDDFYQVEKVDAETSKLILQMSEAFFSLFKDVEPVFIDESLNILPKKDRNIVVLFYGLDGINCLDYDEICTKFNLSEDEVDKVLENSIKKIKAHVTKKENVKVRESFSKKGHNKENKYLSLIDTYGQERVDEIYLKLTDEEKEFISLFYGECPKTAKQIAEKFGFSLSKAYSSIVDIINKIELLLKYEETRQTSSEFYKKFDNHSVGEIDGILKQLHSKNQEITRHFYGINCIPKSISDLSQNYECSELEIAIIIEETANKINRKLELLDNVDTNKFYEKFDGFTKEEIDAALLKLDDKDKDIISSCFGLYGKIMSKGQISNKYSTSVKDINESIVRIIKNIRKSLRTSQTNRMGNRKNNIIPNNSLNLTNEHKKKNDAENKYQELVDKYGIEKVNFYISCLKDKEQEIIKLHFGIDCDKVTNKVISEKLNISYSGVGTTIKNIIKKFENLLENPEQLNVKKKEEKVTYKENDKLLYEYLVNGNNDAYIKLMDVNKALVYKILKKIYNGQAEKLNDFMEEYGAVGFIGLSKAITSFDVNKIGKIKFATYATVVIKNEIYMEFRKKGKEADVISYEEDVDDTENLSLKDMLADEENFVEDVIEKDHDKYKSKMIEKAILNLNDKERKAIVLHFGFNGEPKSEVEVAKIMGISRSYVSRIIAGAKEKLAINLNDFKEEYNTDYNSLKNKELINKMNKAFYSLFGTTNKKTVQSRMFKLLNKIYLKIISDYYGLDGVNCKDYDEIASEMNITIDRVNEIVEEAILIIKNNRKYNDSIEIGFDKKYLDLVSKNGEDNVAIAFSMLDDNKKKYLEMFFGINREAISCNDIIELTGINKSILHNDIANGLNKIEYYLENKKDLLKRCQRFYGKFEGYNLDKINLAISKLDKADKELIEIYYSLKGNFMKIDDIAKKYELSRATLQSKILRSNKKIEHLLKNPEELVSKKDKFYKMFEKYSEEEISSALNSLKEIDREIVCLYFGLSVNCLTQKEISNKFDIPESSVSAKIKTNLKKIENFLQKEPTTKESFYKIFEDYTKEQVDEAISKLSLKSKNIIELLYGLNDEILTAKEIADRFGMSLKGIYANKKNNIEKIKNILSKPETLLEDEKKIKNNKYLELINKYGEETVLENLNRLKEKARSYIVEYYGIDCESSSQKDIALKYDISQNAVCRSIKSSIEKIEYYILNPNKIKRKKEIIKKANKYQELVIKYGEEEVKKAFSKISDTAIKIMTLYYGIDCDAISAKEIAKQLNISENLIFYHTKKSIVKLEQYLINPSLIKDKKDEFYLMFAEHSREEIDSVIAKLDEKSRDIISLLYGLNGKCLSMSKIGNLYNYSQQSISTHKKRIINKIKAILENPNISDGNNNVKIKKNNKYEELVKKHGAEKVDKVIEQLDDNEKNIIKLYCGIGKDACSGQKIADTLKMPINKVYSSLKNIFECIEKYIDNPEMINSEKTKLRENNKYQKLIEKYGQEKVNEQFLKLKPTAQLVLKYYFGIEEEILSAKEISTKLNIKPNTVYYHVDNSIKNIENCINNPYPTKDLSHKKKTSNKYVELVSKYEKEKVEEAFSKLSYKTQEIMIAYYGINTKELGSKEIAKLHNCKENLVFYHARGGIKKLEKYIINPPIKKNKTVKNVKKDTRLDDLKEKYGQEEVEQVLSMLEEKELNILKLYFGIDCESKSQKEIGEKYNVTSTAIWKSIKKSLNRIIDLLENPKVEFAERTAFYTKFKDFTTEQVIEAIEKLDERERNIITDYYGLNGVKMLSGSGICHKYDIPIGSVYSYINKIEKILYNKVPIVRNESSRKEELYKNFKGYSKKKIIDAINELNPINRGIMHLYYGIGCEEASKEEICRQYNCDENLVNCAITYSFSFIKGLLANKKKVPEEKKDTDRKEKFKKLINKYGEKEVYNVLNTLTESEQAFLTMYYTLGKIKNYSLDEISQKIKIDETKLSFLEEKILEKVIAVLDNNKKKALIDKMRRQFLEDVTIEDKTKVKAALKSLKENEIKWVATYYGLNGKDIMTIDEMSKRFNIDKEAIKNYLANIMKKLNSYKPSEGR